MSPVPRGRKSKPTKKSRKKAAPQENRTSAPDWFQPGLRRTLDGCGGLIDAAGPRELEQRTAELLGAELHRTLQRAERIPFLWWAELLTRSAADAVLDGMTSDDAHRRGPLYLLHGMASIAPAPLQKLVQAERSRATKAVRRQGHHDDLPPWLTKMHKIAPTGSLRLMRDAFGDRFGVIAGYRYPDEAESMFLFDIQGSGLVSLAGAGDFDTVEEATRVWQESVGATGPESQPRTVDTPGELHCMVPWRSEDLMGDEGRAQMDNYFRAPRRRDDVVHFLANRGTPLPKVAVHFDCDGEDTEEAEDDFIDWYVDRHGTEPDPEAVTDLAMEWFEGALTGIEHVVSEYRVGFMLDLIGDWKPGPPTDAARLLLPEWVRWSGEQAGQPADLVDRAVTAARPS